MPDAPLVLPPISIRDFTPGIADDPGVNYPPGQATRQNTFGCYALSTGALVPAFRSVYTRAGDHFEASNPSASLGYFCAGIYMVGPVLPTAATISSVPAELWIATEWALTTPTKKRRLQRVLLDENPVVTEDIITQSDASATDATIMWQAFFCQNRSNQSNPTQVGIPVVIIGWGSSIVAFANIWEFPNDTTPTLNTPKVIANISGQPISHQGRVVWHEPTSYHHGVDTDYATGENLRWTDTNDVSGISAYQAFYPESADGYSVKASMTANQLLLIKETGAIVVYGDLDNPTVNNLPAVPGNAELFSCNGARTPLGFLYPARGVWSWSTGDSAENIAPNMDPDFYKPPAVGGIEGAWWYPINNWVFLSNNFFFDTLTRGLWQIEDPTTVRYAYVTGARHLVYMAKNFYTNASDALITGYDLNLSRRSYSWQSQPIWESIGRTIKITEFELIAKGQGTVAITLTGRSGATTTVSVTLVNAGYPERFRENIAIQGEYVQVKIVANSGSDSVEGATIYELILEPESRAQVKVTV